MDDTTQAAAAAAITREPVCPHRTVTIDISASARVKPFGADGSLIVEFSTDSGFDVDVELTAEQVEVLRQAVQPKWIDAAEHLPPATGRGRSDDLWVLVEGWGDGPLPAVAFYRPSRSEWEVEGNEGHDRVLYWMPIVPAPAPDGHHG